MDVEVGALPDVEFVSFITSGCQPLDVFFSVDDAGPGASYYWNFGNGQTSTDPVNTSTTYDFWDFMMSSLQLRILMAV